MEPRTEAAAPEPPAGGSLLARPQLRARLPAREANPSLTQGAFSRCYKLTDMSTSAVFALKVVPRAGRLPSRGKVEREIALHSRLRHHNIVAFHGHFADRDHVYMVLEYCSRQSLAHVLKARQTLTEPEVRYYLRGVIGGLRYLHQQRIVHRDLKLSNLFLNKKMEVKIGDLGLATRLGPGGRCHRVLCGTPNLLAPEVVSRKGHSCPSDIWALGCIMYTVLTGTPPFAAASLSEMYQNICDGHYPEPAHLSPNARRLIARLLAPDPAERPNLDHLLQDDFFTQGFTLDRMPPHSRHSPPAFTFPQPVGSLFRKVGQLLSTQCGPPCPCTSKEASGPGEEGPEPDSLDWGSEASLSERGAHCPQALVHLFTQGTLRSDPAGEPRDGGGSRHQEPTALPGRWPCGPTGPPRGAAAPPLGSQVGGSFQQVWLWLPAVGWGQWSPVSGWHPHGPAPPRKPHLLPARPREAGDLRPEGRAPGAGRQAGRPAAPHRLHAEAPAGGELGGRERGPRPDALSAGGGLACPPAARRAGPLPAALPGDLAGAAAAVQQRDPAGQLQWAADPACAEWRGPGAAAHLLGAGSARCLLLSGHPAAPRVCPGCPAAPAPHAPPAAELIATKDQSGPPRDGAGDPGSIPVPAAPPEGCRWESGGTQEGGRVGFLPCGLTVQPDSRGHRLGLGLSGRALGEAPGSTLSTA
ncbi:inactive serine/threonine-protein kinase PLK5 isoform X3 [Marmota marmota marmota]|uniref:inactive serine/threonine-protein kinase PLK5 isoform X3 n=1 Tax=Marmota marmota marmota TaxID=9994 RepID=UPI0020922349|nr:inactive serine/threonine-protein kinase PLK5 isoform X3 [Marmota marmota marmota]